MNTIFRTSFLAFRVFAVACLLAMLATHPVWAVGGELAEHRIDQDALARQDDQVRRVPEADHGVVRDVQRAEIGLDRRNRRAGTQVLAGLPEIAPQHGQRALPLGQGRRVHLIAECAVGIVRRPLDALQTRTLGVGAEHGVLQPGACAQGQERGERSQSRKRPRCEVSGGCPLDPTGSS